MTDKPRDEAVALTVTQWCEKYDTTSENVITNLAPPADYALNASDRWLQLDSSPITSWSFYNGSSWVNFIEDKQPEAKPSTRRMITIRHNTDYNSDTVEILDGARQLGFYELADMHPEKLAELLRWFGHPVRLVDYMFEHDISEFG